VRRNLVYSFFNSLKKHEFSMFFDELLRPFKSNSLASLSFNAYIKSIKQIDVVLKQMGQLIGDFLPELTKLVLAMLKNAKIFGQHLKNSAGALGEEEEEEEKEAVNERKQELHFQALKQQKQCVREGMSLLK